MKSHIDSAPVSEASAPPRLLSARPPLYSELERIELYYSQRLASMQSELDSVRDRLRSVLVVHHIQLESLNFELMRDLKALRNLGASHSNSL